LSGVRLRRGGRTVLDIDTAQLPLAQPLALIGPNGAGKSTLARWLAGLGQRGSGTLTMGGQPLSWRTRLDVCYLVAQNTNQQLFTDTVLAETILGDAANRRTRLGVARRGKEAAPNHLDADAETSAQAILEELDLAQLAARHPLSLSGGEKQRLVIAVALAAGRRLIILDEPTSGLDAAHMRQVADAISAAHRRGAAVIIVTHDADLVALTCGSAARLDSGRLAELIRLDATGLDAALAFLAPAAPR
jgi:energy-coupling factor transport system ATP-binding protein